MIIKEPGIKESSVRYFFTPSSFAEQVLFYPTRVAHYQCSRAYHFSSNSEIGQQPSHHFHYMLFLITEGSMNLLLEGKQYKAGKGDAVIFDCKRPHEYISTSDQLDFYWLVFDGTMTEQLFDCILELHDENHVFEASDQSQLQHQFGRFLSFGESGAHVAEITLSEIIYSMLCKLFMKKRIITPDSIALVEKAMNYMDLNFHRQLSVTDVAKHVGLSSSYLTRCFRQQTGCSPHEYLTLRRISRGKELLLAGRDTVKEIALKTGYKSEENFIRSFKSQVGVSPAVFRKYPI